MADLKDLKQAILEIPKLVESLKKQKLTSEKARLAEMKTTDGMMLYYEGDTLQPGMSIVVIDGNDKKACPDGEYITDTIKITVKHGKAINVQPASMHSGFAALKPHDKPAPKKEEAKLPESAPELKLLKENFDKTIVSQREQFEKEINELKDSFNSQAAELKAITESQNKTLKEMFDLIERIAKTPSLPSDFKKKDGEPSRKPKNVFEEAKALSQKVFPN